MKKNETTSPTPNVPVGPSTADPQVSGWSVGGELQDPCYFCEQGEKDREELQRKEQK